MAWWKKGLCMILNVQQYLHFVFQSLCVYLFMNCLSPFLSHQELAEPLRNSVSSFQKPKQKPDIQSGAGTIQILQYVENKRFFHRDTFTILVTFQMTPLSIVSSRVAFPAFVSLPVPRSNQHLACRAGSCVNLLSSKEIN